MGTSVNEKSSDPSSAETMVYAMGAKMRPSWRKALSPGRDDINLTIAVKVGQHPTGDGRGAQAPEHILPAGRRRSPTTGPRREAENQ
jgi:hypothetical protein